MSAPQIRTLFEQCLAEIAHTLANATHKPLKNTLIRYFVWRYPLRMEEACEPNPLAYPSFNAFFTRALRPDVRPPPTHTVGELAACADGVLSHFGRTEDARTLPIKGVAFTPTTLLGSHHDAARFAHGSYQIYYLAPTDYHRVHMPHAGQLRHMRYIPGRLYSVNPRVLARVPGVFYRNERVICLFETETHGAMAVVLVGARIVGRIHTAWHAGPIGGIQRTTQIEDTSYAEGPQLSAGDLLGHFELGSTVVVLTERPIHFDPAITPGRVPLYTSVGVFASGVD